MKSLICCFFFILSTGVSFSQVKVKSEWLLLYYIPYDNDLSTYADSVIQQLEIAKELDNVNVLVQIDLADSLGARRYAIANDTTIIDTIGVEKSYKKRTLKSFFKWASENYESYQTGIFFLNHGGRPDEVGMDRYPDSTFLKTKDIRKSMAWFNKKKGHLTDLLYLQVCNKASIEALYEFKDVSLYTLASQSLLGAPNYYYEEAFEILDSLPTMSGGLFAKKIAQAEDTSMYSSLTCIYNLGFTVVRQRFNEYIAAINSREDFGLLKAPTPIVYGRDRYWDLYDFIFLINSTSQDELLARKNLEISLQVHLHEFTLFNPNVPLGTLGISIPIPSKRQIRDFRHMQFYKDIHLENLPLN